ncbi:MAG: radical SAM protein, partial [Candidatus Hodarchaeota archaeon]
MQLAERALLPVAKSLYKIPLVKKEYFRHYASYKFLRLKVERKLHLLRPPAVQWLATYNCNFRCKHCEASAGSTNVSELTTNEALKLITELSKMKVERIAISGGEPLLRKDLFRIIHHILDKGMQYAIASNGYLVSNFKEKFSNMKPYMFFTSIDGLEQTNDNFRGRKGAFKKTFRALEFFKSIGVEKRTINTVVFPGNIKELPELKKIILNSAASFWRLVLAIPVGRAKDNNDMYLNKEQTRYFFKFVGQARREFNVGISEEVGYLGCLPIRDSLTSYPFFCDAG